ncbi:HDOD domain-containing protein [Anaeroselena agilis]|uniref:HDOD domain-containing protein n=1 Tax=Anaeroselena agilis TaxID=3063788 RepID=A0ABU3NST7_9FIRM|nr:HDOD domain-containing protein [Selenomonadales bacterium 4137-cl]
MGNRILFVDDEKAILRAIDRLLFDSEYEVLTAESGQAGLELLAAGPVDVVVSDIRMPGMDGHQFLREVKTLYPRTTRLILSGYAEESAILNSIVDGSSNMYMLKPWEGQDLKVKLAQIFAARGLYNNKTTLEFADKLENLSIAPGVYGHVVKLTENGADATEIAGFIESDPAAAAAVLRVVNSAFSGGETGSIAKAITSLGLTVVKTVVLACSLFKFANFNVPPFSPEKLTQKACAANKLMTLIYSDLLGKLMPDASQTAALLIDVGLLLCLHYFPEQYERIMREYAQGPEQDFAELEKGAFGVTHREFGGYLLNWWGLPYPIVETALFHHDPFRDAIMNRELVAVAHVADYYAWQTVGPEFARRLEPGVFEVLGFSEEDLRPLMKGL